MKTACLLLCLSITPLLAQIEPGEKYEIDLSSGDYLDAAYAREFSYEVRIVDGIKTLYFDVQQCIYLPFGIVFVGGTSCHDVGQTNAARSSAVAALIQAFYSQFPQGTTQYGAFARPESPEPRFTTAAPQTQAAPRMIFLDGLGNSLMAIDTSTLNTVSQVVVPSTVGPFGIRPSQILPANEVWVANGGTGVTVADLGTQQVVTNIPTPQLPVALRTAGIVFSNDGKTAFEAVQYSSADTSGNNGALVVFDAVNRKVTSTLLFKFQPVAILAAPDGYSLYLLNSDSTITYYDILSGTADLTISTFTPGQAGGFNPSSSVYIHPDGTRLFWHEGGTMEVFDLTSRKVVNRFSSGLTTTLAPAMTVSQDGAKAYFSNAAGDVAAMDTSNGVILHVYNEGTSLLVYGGPPTN